MSQLRQRVVLVHELGQLGASEELLHCCSDRFDIDQGLRGDALPYPELSYAHEPLAPYGTDRYGTGSEEAHRRHGYDGCPDGRYRPYADAAFQMHVVVDGSNDIFLGNMLRNQLVDILWISFFKLFLVIPSFFQNVFNTG